MYNILLLLSGNIILYRLKPSVYGNDNGKRTLETNLYKYDSVTGDPKVMLNSKVNTKLFVKHGYKLF